MAWPNPQRPGEPADANRPWHWVSRRDDAGAAPLPIGWNGALGQWMIWDGSQVSASEAAQRFAYLAPCLTLGETEAALAARAAAAEPRGLAALAASADPAPPPAMIYKKDAVRMHLVVFAGTLITTLFLAEKVVRW